ncbi:MAG: hypothetical protein KFF50_08565, partial [Desulfatitalea sp.]|nr:hypothetical protein [Desulfatitalea sp.]
MKLVLLLNIAHSGIFRLEGRDLDRPPGSTGAIIDGGGFMTERMLIIDDDTMVLEACRRVFVPEGY